MQQIVRTSMLTTRQDEIVSLIAAGLTNQEIANRLGITPTTVSEHIANILWRLGLTCRREIAAWAIEQAWSSRGQAR